MPASQTQNPLVQAMKNLFSRFTQSPNVYPIKFYKKGERFKKYRKMYSVK